MFCLGIKFNGDTCRWEYCGESKNESVETDLLYGLLDKFIRSEWRGTATELCGGLKKLDSDFVLTPAALGKQIKNKDFCEKLQKDFGIIIESVRSGDARKLSVSRKIL
jgi:hypothetical protein